MKSFTQKLIELRITLAQGSFGGKGNTKIIRQLSCDVEIEKAGRLQRTLPRSAFAACCCTIWNSSQAFPFG